MSQVHLEKITPMNWHDVEDLHVGKDHKTSWPTTCPAWLWPG